MFQTSCWRNLPRRAFSIADNCSLNRLLVSTGDFPMLSLLFLQSLKSLVHWPGPRAWKSMPQSWVTPSKGCQLFVLYFLMMVRVFQLASCLQLFMVPQVWAELHHCWTLPLLPSHPESWQENISPSSYHSHPPTPYSLHKSLQRQGCHLHCFPGLTGFSC